ncbi:nuclear transport factor 2 family protein [Streptomyces sp. NPDC002896]|uniref:nuclear transport factor 2 family protein n=1 Tax=Streptomyces sp. NPDC002896 TaxID=3154438 RepID=UPI003328F4B2
MTYRRSRLAADHTELLWAERCVRRLPMLYARGVDRRDWQLVRSCFADGAFVAGTRDALPVDEYLARLRPGVECFPVTMHFMGNQLADVDEGCRSGQVETYAVAYHFQGDTAGADHPDNLVVGVRYHDEVVCTEQGWRIIRRSVSGDWRNGPYPGRGT